MTGAEFGAWVGAAVMVIGVITTHIKSMRDNRALRASMQAAQHQADLNSQRPDVDMAKQAFEAMKNLADSYEEEIKRRDLMDKNRDDRERELIDEIGRLRVEIFALKTLLSSAGIGYPTQD